VTIRRAMVLVVLTVSSSLLALGSTETEKCLAHIETAPARVHENSDCLAAAEQGDAEIQLALGRSYGPTSRSEELRWYGRAADAGYVEAYLAIGDFFRNIPTAGPQPSIDWYTRYWNANGRQKGYAAAFIARLEAQRSNVESASIWRSRCEEAEHESCEL